MACLAPWAYGSVEAWAELALDAGIVLIAILALFVGTAPSGSVRSLFLPPSLALAGLALLALAQAAPLPEGILKRLDPASSAARSILIPVTPERIVGDTGPPVALPEATLSLSPEESVHAAARLAAMWALFQCVIGLGGSDAVLRRLGVALAVNSAAMALFALLQALTWQGKIYGIRASPVADAWSTGGPFVGHNPLAAYLNLGLGLGLGILLSGRGPHRRGAWAWAAYTSGLTVVGLLASHSRSGLAALPVAAVVLAVFLRPRARARATVAIASVVLLAIPVLVAMGSTSPFLRLATLLDESAYSDRLEIWAASLRTWVAHPFLGTGLGSFAIAAAPAFRLDRGVVFARAEDEYLDLLVEGGLLGLGLGLVGVVSVFRSGLRAIHQAAEASDRALITGALFGLTALAAQSLGDFSPHIPGVAIPAVILCGLVCSLGSPGEDRPDWNVGRGDRWKVGPWIIVAVGLAVLAHDFPRARAESWLADSGLPAPGAGMPAAISPKITRPTLERMKTALEGALRDRPRWAEGHLRLGMVFMARYRNTASAWVSEVTNDPLLSSRLADPLWLHATVHSAPPGDHGWGQEVIGHEPVRRELTRAARCFLEARRCCPSLAQAHASLASLDYLLEGGEPAPVHAGRALRLAGPDSGALMLAAQAAAQAGDSDLAARAWRRSIEVRESNWQDVADAASVVLSPEMVLKSIVPPGGRWPIRFADRLYASPEDRGVRGRYLEEALRQLGTDHSLGEPERLRLEAVAWAGLGENARARAPWERALTLEPAHAAWREEFVAWLVGRGDIEAAHAHAVLGLRLSPGHPGLRSEVLATAEALARGRPAP